MTRKKIKMKRLKYWVKLINWEIEGYDVSILREKYSNELRKIVRYLLLIFVSVVVVSLLIWTIITVIPPEQVVVTFVVDTSTSMNDEDKLENTKEELVKALNSMNKESQAGVVFFNDTMHDEIASYEPRLAFDGGPFGIKILQPCF